MVYPTKEYGAAVGEIVAALASIRDVSGIEVRMTSDDITAKVLLGGKVRGEACRPPASEPGPKGHMSHTRYGVVECDGESHTVKEWAEILGVGAGTITARLRTYGNPKGRRGPTDEDAVKLS